MGIQDRQFRNAMFKLFENFDDKIKTGKPIFSSQRSTPVDYKKHDGSSYRKYIGKERHTTNAYELGKGMSIVREECDESGNVLIPITDQPDKTRMEPYRHLRIKYFIYRKYELVSDPDEIKHIVKDTAGIELPLLHTQPVGVNFLTEYSIELSQKELSEILQPADNIEQTEVE